MKLFLAPSVKEFFGIYVFINFRELRLSMTDILNIVFSLICR